MAKAKGGLKPEDIKKYYFWVVLPLIIILAFVFTFMAKAKIKKDYAAKTSALTSAKGEVDTIAGNKKHPNENTIKEIKAETSVLADKVYAAWIRMYDDQKVRNRWPRQLSAEFLDLVENKLKFRDPIGVGKSYLLEDYGYFIASHLPDLLKEMNLRRCQVREYKLLKQAEMDQLNIRGLEERFWPVYVDRDAEGREQLYVAIYSNLEDENSPIKDVFLYDIKTDLLTVPEQTVADRLKAKEREPYYREVAPMIMEPKDNMTFGIDTSNLDSLFQTGGGSGGMAMPGGAGMGGAGGSSRGAMEGGAGGSSSGGGMEGLGVGSVPGDGYDPAVEQVSGTTLAALGGGNNNAMGGRGGAGGGAAQGGAGMGGRSNSRRGGAAGGAGGAGAAGVAQGMGGGSTSNADDSASAMKIYPGLPSYKDRRRIVGNVDWPDPEIYTMATWEEDAFPTSIEIWYVQETLWVYEALIRVIADTNKEYPDNISKVPVKCVEEMLIGQNAAAEFSSLETTIGDLTGTAAAASGGMSSVGPPSGMDGGAGGAGGASGPSAMMMGGSVGGVALTGSDEAQQATRILTGRYIGEENKPLLATDKPPFAEFNKMPICLKVAIDQRRIPELLVACANCSMPIDVKHVRICPDNNVPFTMPVSADASAAGGPGGASGGMGGGMGGPSGAGMMMAGGAAGGEKKEDSSRGAAGEGGVAIGRSELSQSEYGVDTIRVQVFGVINIFNEPNKENFATGANADEANASIDAELSTTTDSGASNEAVEVSEEGAAAAENGLAPAADASATDTTAPAVDASATDTTAPAVDASATDTTAPAVDASATDAAAPAADASATEAAATPDDTATAPADAAPAEGSPEATPDAS